MIEPAEVPAPPPPTPPPSYPVRLEVDYPERLSRLSTFFRLILAIPVLIMAWILMSLTTGVISGLLFVYWVMVLVRGQPVGATVGRQARAQNRALFPWDGPLWLSVACACSARPT